MQKEQLPRIKQTEALSRHSSLSDVFHMLKIWEQPSMKQGKLFSPHIFQQKHHWSTKNAANRPDLIQTAE